MSRSHQLGDLQLAIMRILWKDGEATVASVHEALRESRGLALTTIATMLSKMEKKGVVKHRSEGRQYVFSATISEEAVHKSMVSELTERLFAGSAAELVNHLLTQQSIDRDELTRITQLIENAEKGSQ